MSDRNLSAFLWSVADLLRGDYRQSDNGKVILPFTVLRQLDCVLETTKADVLEEKAAREKQGLNPEPFLLRKAGQHFFNTSSLDLKRLMGDQDHIGEKGVRLPRMNGHCPPCPATRKRKHDPQARGSNGVNGHDTVGVDSCRGFSVGCAHVSPVAL